ncbi:LegC family aminotransferase [Carnobacterium antarcticum]|uniref:LegC family aminotransferase n=1 Tax=Carnobacterium antarcticum TaxID=2126436 RepID=A0ABW4NM50_9LACT|nr:LegC family aminotransferase [Carnobacterium sp. CP1]ALV21574.1 Bacillosamine/Legionaminic acid biosynthesis aminotransferase PglE 4-keto-6-deoxy-N-Acetyl-D-hexosaminyl-(Lipid carrier) aminotransferase [Carnobacterium sp. CP1]
MERKFIPLSVPNIKGNELEYVTQAVKDEWVSTGGSYIETFEKNISDYLGVEQAAAVQSGTAGLHLSLIQSGVGVGDEVFAATLTFIAAVNPIRYVGAEPIFMDCDDSLCIDPDKILQFIKEECTFTDGILTNNQTKRQIKAILGVHVFGNLMDMEKLVEIADQYNLKLIEDATEALGSYYTEGKYKGQYAGTIGDFGVYSFNGNKIITTGGGGMVVAKKKEDLDYLKYLSTQAKDDTTSFIHHAVGYNYRMTNLQAALGVGQLEQLESFIETKKANYDLYKELFDQNEKVEVIDFDATIRPNYWFYALRIKNDPDIQGIIQALHEKGIQTRPIWGLIHEQKPYLKAQSYKIEKATYYVKHILNIPCSSNLEQDDVRYVAECLNEIL